MPSIRYVCLSDMHLGEEDSLLTSLVGRTTNINPSQPSPVMEKLVECLRDLLSKAGSEKPTLILNGDILEMALCGTHQAAMVFERFIERIMLDGDPLFGEIVYVPGNHDHHLWEVARETQYVNYMINEVGPGDKLEKPWHISRLFPKAGQRPLIAYFLTKLIQRHEKLKDFEITAAYPNYGLYKAQTNRCVLFHHGHYIEPLYMLMSHLRTMLFADNELPTEVKDIEEENFAWIDFFWSAMGRSGKVGEDIELIYEMAQSEEGLKALIRNLAEGIVNKFGRGNKMPDFIEEGALRLFFNALADAIVKNERRQTKEPLSKKSKDGLRSYVEGPLYKQLAHELEGAGQVDATFVFGHTHKPYSIDEKYDNYLHHVNVFNSGGWVVESEAPEPRHGGAIILIDEDLNAASLRMYNEAESPGDYKVAVENATHIGEHPNLLYDELLRLVDPDSEPWSGFSKVTSEEVALRHDNMRKKVRQRI